MPVVATERREKVLYQLGILPEIKPGVVGMSESVLSDLVGAFALCVLNGLTVSLAIGILRVYRFV